jgi:hypothetical protein
MRAAAQASITGTIATGILSSVRRKKAGRGRYRVASEDLRCGQKQQEKRDHAPDCRPMLHWSDVFIVAHRTNACAPCALVLAPCLRDTPYEKRRACGPPHSRKKHGLGRYILQNSTASPDKLKTDGRRYSPLMKMISPGSTAMRRRCARRLEQNPVRRIA